MKQTADDGREEHVSDLNVFEAIRKSCMSVAVTLLCAGIPCASASAETGVVKPGLIHPHNLDFKKCPYPDYPEREREQNHQGTVKLRFLLGADGTVRRTLVEASSGYPALDDAARAAIAGCRFNPPLIDGQSVEGWTTTQYSFQRPAPGYSTVLLLVPVLVGFWLAFRTIRSYGRSRSPRLSA